MPIGRVLWSCVALSMFTTTGLPAEPPASEVFEQGGARLEFSLAPAVPNGPGLRTDEDAIARLRVTDSRTGAPLAGGRPRAWIAKRQFGQVHDEAACAAQLRTLLSGALTSQSAINLNLYLILTLNSDRTIAVINPQVGFAATKLETIVPLPANGADWVLSRDKRTLYVSLPDAGQIAIVDVVTRKLTRTLATGDGSAPTRLALRPDGRQLWVGLDGTGEVAVIDTASNASRRVPSGAGLHSLAFTADSRLVYVSNSGEDTVSVFDADTVTKRTDIPVPGTPVALAYGPASRAVLVAALNADTITVIDADQNRAPTNLPARRGNVAIAFEPEGRYAFAVNQFDSTVAVIDSANGRTTSIVSVAKEPDQVTFSRRYAYVRGLQSETFSLINLQEARASGATSVNIQAGALAPAALPLEIGPGRMIVPTPDGDSALIANGPEGTIYQYDEGMMVPAGSFSNYKRVARALLLLDRSLQEVAPGEFSAIVRLHAAGRFDVPVLLDQPRLTHCFEVTIAERIGDAVRRGKLRFEPVAPIVAMEAGRAEAFLFRIVEAGSEPAGRAVPDLEVLALRPPGIWRQRTRVEHVGDDLVRFTLTVPVAGRYQVVFSSRRLGLLGSLELTARDADAAFPAKSTR